MSTVVDNDYLLQCISDLVDGTAQYTVLHTLVAHPLKSRAPSMVHPEGEPQKRALATQLGAHYGGEQDVNASNWTQTLPQTLTRHSGRSHDQTYV